MDAAQNLVSGVPRGEGIAPVSMIVALDARVSFQTSDLCRYVNTCCAQAFLKHSSRQQRRPPPMESYSYPPAAVSPPSLQRQHRGRPGDLGPPAAAHVPPVMHPVHYPPFSNYYDQRRQQHQSDNYQHPPYSVSHAVSAAESPPARKYRKVQHDASDHLEGAKRGPSSNEVGGGDDGSSSDLPGHESDANAAVLVAARAMTELARKEGEKRQATPPRVERFTAGDSSLAGVASSATAEADARREGGQPVLLTPSPSSKAASLRRVDQSGRRRSLDDDRPIVSVVSEEKCEETSTQ